MMAALCFAHQEKDQGMTKATVACPVCADTALLPDTSNCGCRGLGCEAAKLAVYWAEPYAIPANDGPPQPLRHAPKFSAVADIDGRLYICESPKAFRMQRRPDMPPRLRVVPAVQ